MSPIVDAIIFNKSSDLIIETTLGSMKVTIFGEEMDDYPSKMGSEEIKGKL